MYDRHVAQNSLSSTVPDLATDWSTSWTHPIGTGPFKFIEFQAERTNHRGAQP